MEISQKHTQLAQTAIAITHPARQVIIRYLCDNGAQKFTDIHALFPFLFEGAKNRGAIRDRYN